MLLYKFYSNTNIVNTINNITKNSNNNFQIVFSHFLYGISKYDNTTIKITLVGANNIVNQYIDWKITPITG